MLIDFVCLCKYSRRHQAYKNHLLCFCKDLMRKTKNKASLRARVCVRCSQSSLWSQHLLRQNNSAQPQTRPITSTPLLRLQINLIRVYLFPPSSCGLSWSPRLQCHKTADPRDSRRVHWRTDGLGGASCVFLWRQQGSLILLSGRLLEPHSVLPQTDWSWIQGIMRRLKRSAKIKVILNAVVAKHTRGNMN